MACLETVVAVSDSLNRRRKRGRLKYLGKRLSSLDGRTMNVIFTVSFLLIAVAALETHSATIPKRCKCIQNAPNNKCASIKPNMVKRIERLPAGTFCNKEEVIIHFKKGRTLCVDPTAVLVKKLEKTIQLRAAASVNISTTSTPETTTTDN